MIGLDIFSQGQLADILNAAAACDHRLGLDQEVPIYDLRGWMEQLAGTLNRMLRALDGDWSVAAAPVSRRRDSWAGFILLDNGEHTSRLSVDLTHAAALVSNKTTMFAARRGRARVAAQVVDWITKQALCA